LKFTIIDMVLQKIHNLPENSSFVLMTKNEEIYKDFPEQTQEYIKQKIDSGEELIWINRFDFHVFIVIEKYSLKKAYQVNENFRKIGSKIYDIAEKEKLNHISITEDNLGKDAITAIIDGIALASYKFNYYKNTSEIIECPLQTIYILSENVNDKDLKFQQSIYDGVFLARDLVNEPPNTLTPTEFGKRLENLGKSTSIKTALLNKKMIEKEKMTGLLNVSKGSSEPPIFGMLEYYPVESVNTRPIVLVGKGIVFDAGGLALKNAEGMADMKADMAGAASVIGTIKAVAAAKLPIRVIGLIPIADNRPGYEAYCPGDILKMMNGVTVEVINPDAEGRLILADALCYAKKFSPQMIISLATLSYSAQRAFGKYAAACQTTVHESFMNVFRQSAEKTYERIAEIPNFDEYELMLKSDIADIKNVGGSEAGMITAGKFLQKFTDFPFIHLDIAGTAFSEKKDDYISKGGTGYGVRLLTEFMRVIAYEAV
jgi:leucyl aminopeptidase